MHGQPNSASGAPQRAEPAAVSPRQLYFFDLYRLFEAGLLVAFCFSPLSSRMIVLVSTFTAQATAVAYLLGAVALYLQGRRERSPSRLLVLLGLSFDLLAALTALAAIQGLDSGIAALLLVNICCAALLLPPRWAYGFVLLAATTVWVAFGSAGEHQPDPGSLTQGGLFAASYLAAALLLQLLQRQASEAAQLVKTQESDLVSLTQLNDLIIRRMQVGVLVVDARNRIRQINESARALMGTPPHSERHLAQLAPEIARRLHAWRTQRKQDNTPVALCEGFPEVVPRFVRLDIHNDHDAIVFLEDTSLASRQAEQLTLSSLGRLSASIAHEIRNPLAAISYSIQLLAESNGLSEVDQRMVEIIRAQCGRVNAIIDNILQLSRRERSRPEPVELGAWVTQFVDDYKITHPMEQDELKAVPSALPLVALVDPSQLQQIVWNLVHNARRYGRFPQQPARVSVVARQLHESGPPVIEVIDRGPGIPAKVAARIFDPFFTTHEFGTGLGLYIARELCDANQAQLEWLPVAGGGCCFRITFSFSKP